MGIKVIEMYYANTRQRVYIIRLKYAVPKNQLYAQYRGGVHTRFKRFPGRSSPRYNVCIT